MNCTRGFAVGTDHLVSTRNLLSQGQFCPWYSCRECCPSQRAGSLNDREKHPNRFNSSSSWCTSKQPGASSCEEPCPWVSQSRSPDHACFQSKLTQKPHSGSGELCMEAIESPRIDKYFNVTSELRHVLNSSAAQNPRGLRLEITVTVEYGEKSL